MWPKVTSVPLFLLVVASLLAIVCPAFAETGTYQVPPQQQQIIPITLNSGDSASGSLVVNGRGNVDFWISDPQGNNVTTYSGQTEFSLDANTSGTFAFHIFNLSTDASVSVTLNYNVVYEIFGMPQEMFILLVIVGVALLMIIVWATMSKKL